MESLKRKYSYFQEILESKTEELEKQREKLLHIGDKSKSDSNKKKTKDPGGLVVDMAVPVHVDKPVKPLDSGGDVKYNVQVWSGNYIGLKKEVSVSHDMCSWGDAPKAQSDVQVSESPW